MQTLAQNPNYAVIDLETCGLEPKFDHITCVGFLNPTGIHQFSVPPQIWNADKDAAEKIILNNSVHFLKNTDFLADKPLIISYNGVKFDMPFLKERFQKQVLAIPENFNFLPHLDLMAFAKMQTISDRSPSGYYVSKDDCARKYANLHVPFEIPAPYLARIYRFQKVTMQEHLAMLAHNAQDLATTAQIYDRFAEYPDFQEFAAAHTIHPQNPNEVKIGGAPEKDEEIGAFL